MKSRLFHMVKESTFSFQVFFAMHSDLTLHADRAVHTYFRFARLEVVVFVIPHKKL